MQILTIERELKSLDPRHHEELLREEAATVWASKKQSVIREIWFTEGDRHAVVMLECASAAEAARHLSTLPLVRDGFVRFEVMALRSYDGFDRLIGAGKAPKQPSAPVQAVGRHL